MGYTNTLLFTIPFLECRYDAGDKAVFATTNQQTTWCYDRSSQLCPVYLGTSFCLRKISLLLVHTFLGFFFFVLVLLNFWPELCGYTFGQIVICWASTYGQNRIQRNWFNWIIGQNIWNKFSRPYASWSTLILAHHLCKIIDMVMQGKQKAILSYLGIVTQMLRTESQKQMCREN